MIVRIVSSSSAGCPRAGIDTPSVQTNRRTENEKSACVNRCMVGISSSIRLPSAAEFLVPDRNVSSPPNTIYPPSVVIRPYHHVFTQSEIDGLEATRDVHRRRKGPSRRLRPNPPCGYL